MKTLTILGSISLIGRLQGIKNLEFETFMTENKGKRVAIEVTILDEKGTICQETYYRKVVLPCLQKGFKSTGDDMTMEETHNKVRFLCPATSLIPEDESLSKDDLSELIEWSIRICAINFGIVVPEPNK